MGSSPARTGVGNHWPSPAQGEAGQGFRLLADLEVPYPHVMLFVSLKSS
jgi:hypothetical protein